jgi:hypothetical protein
MKVIQPNCRVQFTADDIDFIVSVLGSQNDQCLVTLLTDPDSRDLILDDERLFKAVLEESACLKISTHFYFYILVRHVLKEAGIEDRSVADYVAEMMSEFSRAEKLDCVIPSAKVPLHYFFDMLAALQTADDRTSFLIRAHIGNQSLFMSGVFPERIRERAERRGFPDLKYYEAMGKTNFRAASDHRLARKYELEPIFQTLSEQFEPTRLALNDLSDRLFASSNGDYLISRLDQKPGGYSF